MLICGLNQQDPVFDGSDVDFDYEIKNDAGELLENIVSIKYKVSDKDSDILAWTSIIPPNPSGTINIPGVNNIIASLSRKEREIALYAIYAGSKVATGKANYTITEITGVTPNSP